MRYHGINFKHVMGIKYLTDGPVPKRIIGHIIDKMGQLTDSGGHMIFLGQVREDEIDGKKVKAIEYSAYEGMVNVEAGNIKKQVLAEFSDVKSIDLIHSTGMVNVGQLSLVVFVSAGHRRQAIQACSKTVELIKERLPVWKKEIFDDYTHLWK